MVDPWPSRSGNTNIAFNGQKMQSAVERYRTDKVTPPVSPFALDLMNQQPAAQTNMPTTASNGKRELGDSYPSLAANIHMANLEIRAGRTLTEALEHFGDRLGIEEARSFATLIQQSDELGSSVNDALRVYSEDMRHKRMSRAEEKAYSLPAKLSVPMMVCIFPVLFVVILLPVIVRLVTNHW